MLDARFFAFKNFLVLLLSQICPVWLLATAASAQITPDATLPSASVVPDNCSNCEITGGSISGNNLFHSFETFSIPAGGEAFFNNALTIDSIFSRVTGSSPSDIDGIIRANGTADLFLINPNGIVFGESASLDLSGSFIGTTANSIIFEDGSEFTASGSQVSPLLTVTAPEGLQFEQSTPSTIINRSSASPGGAVNALEALFGSGPAPVGLQVAAGETLALVGGDILLESGNLTAPGGRIELGSVEGDSIVGLASAPLGWALDYENVDSFSDITLTGFSLVDTSDFIPFVDGTSGAVSVVGDRISLEEGSQIFAINLGDSAGLPIIVQAADSVTIDGFDEASGELSSIYTVAGGMGAAGDIVVSSDALTISQEANIASVTVGPGDTGNVSISAENAISIPDGTGIFTQVFEGATGNGQDIALRARNLSIENGAQVASSTFGDGDSGDINIVVLDSISLSGSINFLGLDGVTVEQFPSSITSAVSEGSSGNSGRIVIETGQLSVTDGAQVSNTVLGSAEGSDIRVTATNSILLSGTTPDATFLIGSSGIIVAADPAFLNPVTGEVVPTTGTSGNLILNTPKLTVENGARISADTFGTGAGGNVDLNVAELFILEGGQIRAGSLVEEGAVSDQRGPGGTLTVNASDLIEISGIGQIGETVVPSALIVSAEGTGPAGSIIVNRASSGLQIFVNDGDIRTDAQQSAGGSIRIEAGLIRLIGDSDIRTNVASGENNGGAILIIADALIAQDDSDILAFAQDGAGGDITLPAFFAQNASSLSSDIAPDLLDGNDQVDINATGQLASGTVTFPDVSFIENSLSDLPDAPIDTEVLVASSCVSSVAQESGSLVLTGADGIPQQPGGTGVAVVPTGEVRTLSAETEAAETVDDWQIGNSIVEPQSLYQVGSDRIVLSRSCD